MPRLSRRRSCACKSRGPLAKTPPPRVPQIVTIIGCARETTRRATRPTVALRAVVRSYVVIILQDRPAQGQNRRHHAGRRCANRSFRSRGQRRFSWACDRTGLRVPSERLLVLRTDVSLFCFPPSCRRSSASAVQCSDGLFLARRAARFFDVNEVKRTRNNKALIALATNPMVRLREHRDGVSMRRDRFPADVAVLVVPAAFGTNEALREARSPSTRRTVNAGNSSNVIAGPPARTTGMTEVAPARPTTCHGLTATSLHPLVRRPPVRCWTIVVMSRCRDRSSTLFGEHRVGTPIVANLRTCVATRRAQRLHARPDAL
jgi:hypothetical protein